MCGRGTPPNWPKSKKCAPNGPVLIGARLGPWFYGLTENHIIFGAPRNAHFWAARVAITCNTHDFAGNRFAFCCSAGDFQLILQPTARFSLHSRDLAAQHTLFIADTQLRRTQTRHTHTQTRICSDAHNNFTPTHTFWTHTDTNLQRRTHLRSYRRAIATGICWFGHTSSH